MAIRITKKSIRATGRDASGLLIAFADDERLLTWFKEKTGSEDFQEMVKEALVARNINHES